MHGKIEKAVFTPVWSCEARTGLLKCRERSTKYFLSLWKSCDAHIGLFMCLERSRKEFTLTWRPCEACIGLFICLERSRKQFSLVWWSSLLVLYPCYLLLCPVLRSLFLLSIVFLPTLCILRVGSTVSVDITIRRLIILKTFFVLT